MKPPISTLGYTLLGLIKMTPRSGYALRRTFETTPIGHYSSSPGSIYPALKSLMKTGLITQPGKERGAPFLLTESGWQALRHWLELPVDAATFGGEADALLMRFVMLGLLGNRERTLAFLRSFAEAADEHAASMLRFLASNDGQSMPLQARLAVDHGVTSAQSSADWARRCIVTLENEDQ